MSIKANTTSITSSSEKWICCKFLSMFFKGEFDLISDFEKFGKYDWEESYSDVFYLDLLEII
jgi:hypothetical protein